MWIPCYLITHEEHTAVFLSTKILNDSFSSIPLPSWQNFYEINYLWDFWPFAKFGWSQLNCFKNCWHTRKNTSDCLISNDVLLLYIQVSKLFSEICKKMFSLLYRWINRDREMWNHLPAPHSWSMIELGTESNLIASFTLKLSSPKPKHQWHSAHKISTKSAPLYEIEIPLSVIKQNKNCWAQRIHFPSGEVKAKALY